MSTTGHEDPTAALRAMHEVLTAQSEFSTTLLEALKVYGLSHDEHERRLGELEESWASLTLAVGRLTQRCRLIVNMKAATYTLTCLHCGNEYAREAGVQLCGPCWVSLGKPERYLRPADPA